MKNKKLTYFLLVVVAGVWGLIIYKVLVGIYANNDMPVVSDIKATREPLNDYALQKDTTHLLLNYRDPFGVTKQKDTSVKINRSFHPKNIPIVAKPTMNWSFITYSGYIRNPASKRLIALVSINGQNTTLSEGETRNQVKLLKNMRDSIKVSYQGKTKFIAIKSL